MRVVWLKFYKDPQSKKITPFAGVFGYVLDIRHSIHLINH